MNARISGLSPSRPSASARICLARSSWNMTSMVSTSNSSAAIIACLFSSITRVVTRQRPGDEGYELQPLPRFLAPHDRVGGRARTAAHGARNRALHLDLGHGV